MANLNYYTRSGAKKEGTFSARTKVFADIDRFEPISRPVKVRRVRGGPRCFDSLIFLCYKHF